MNLSDVIEYCKTSNVYSVEADAETNTVSIYGNGFSIVLSSMKHDSADVDYYDCSNNLMATFESSYDVIMSGLISIANKQHQ